MRSVFIEGTAPVIVLTIMLTLSRNGIEKGLDFHAYVLVLFIFVRRECFFHESSSGPLFLVFRRRFPNRLEKTNENNRTQN